MSPPSGPTSNNRTPSGPTSNNRTPRPSSETEQYNLSPDRRRPTPEFDTGRTEYVPIRRPTRTTSRHRDVDLDRQRFAPQVQMLNRPSEMATPVQVVPANHQITWRRTSNISNDLIDDDFVKNKRSGRRTRPLNSISENIAPKIGRKGKKWSIFDCLTLPFVVTFSIV